MKEVILRNYQFSILLFIWAAAGAYAGLLAYPIVLGSVVLLKMNDRDSEILIGFFFVMILSDNLDPSTAWAKGLKNLYILMMGAFLILDREKFAPLNRLYKRFIPFFVVAIIAMVFSESIFTSFQKTVSYILIFLIVPNYVQMIYREEGKEFFKDLLYFAFGIIVVGYLMRFYLPTMAFSHGGRLRGIFGNPNGLGIYLIMNFVLFSVVINYYKDLFSRQERIMYYMVFAFIIFATGSRTTMAAVLLFLFYLRFYKMSPLIGFVVFIGSIVSIQYVVPNIPLVLNSLGLQESLRTETLEQGSGRTVAWEFAWETIKESPILGKGISFDEYLMNKPENKLMLTRAGHEGGVHNTYLILWLNTGLIGVLFFFRAFIGTFLRAAKLTKVAIPVMLTVMFSVTFEPWLASSLNPYMSVFLVVFTMISQPEFLEKTEDEPEEAEPEELELVEEQAI
jgi:O-antigen ligase